MAKQTKVEYDILTLTLDEVETAIREFIERKWPKFKGVGKLEITLDYNCGIQKADGARLTVGDAPKGWAV